MNDLAIKAKTDNYALEKIFLLMEPLCRSVALRYSTWHTEFDDLLNYAREDVWYAVKKFEPNGKNFFNYCRMMVVNHTKSRMKRAFGKSKEVNRMAVRLDRPYQMEEGEIDSWYEVIPSANEIEASIFHRKTIASILPIIQSESLSQLEYDSLMMFWFEEREYVDIADQLGVHRKSIDNALQRAKAKLRKNEQLQQIYAEMA